jgi:tetratricopeptide (TPR) repeat protein
LAQPVGSRGWQNACLDEETRLGLLAHSCAVQGWTEEANTYYEDALEIARMIGDEYSTANCLLNLGSLAATVGNNTRAREKWTEALRLFEVNDDPMASTIRQWLLELDKQML